jgi:hypothetical protein
MVKPCFPYKFRGTGVPACYHAVLSPCSRKLSDRNRANEVVLGRFDRNGKGQLKQPRWQSRRCPVASQANISFRLIIYEWAAQRSRQNVLVSQKVWPIYNCRA